MAEYKAVNAEQLDADLTAVADAIRERGGTAEQMSFPDGFVSAVENVPDYLEKRITDTLVEYTNLTVTNVVGGSFANVRSLKNVFLPALKNLSGYAFQNCSSLRQLDFPALGFIGSNAFLNCSALSTLILRGSKMVVLENVDAMNNTPFKDGSGLIYVPSALLSDTDATKDYRRATNWSTYAAQFRALEDWTVDGTTTGVLDWDRIEAGRSIVWISGAISPNGVLDENTARIRTIGFLPSNVTSVSAKSGYEVLAACWGNDGIGLYAPYWVDGSLSRDGKWYTSIDITAVFQLSKNVRLVARRTDGATITAAEGENIIITRSEVQP